MVKKMELQVVKIEMPKECNVVLGMAHFIKTVEDLYEALVNSVPNIKFGIGFCESSAPSLVRCEGNDEELKKSASQQAFKLGCGHCFIIFIKNAYPINVLQKIKQVPEVCNIYAATANPLEIIVTETEQGNCNRQLIFYICGEGKSTALNKGLLLVFACIGFGGLLYLFPNPKKNPISI